MNIHGILLAGGQATRLRPLTNSIPKPLLPVGRYPMIVHPLITMRDAGITLITVVRQAKHAPLFEEKLGDGRQFDVRITYADHPAESYGMPYAIGLAEQQVQKGMPVCVLCADVLFDGSLDQAVTHSIQNPNRTVIIAGKADDTAGYSHIEHTASTVTSILDKDRERHMPGIVDLGGALYPADVFNKIRNLFPADREVLITDLNNLYLAEQRLDVATIDGWWSDVGGSIEEYNKINTRYEQQQ